MSLVVNFVDLVLLIVDDLLQNGHLLINLELGGLFEVLKLSDGLL